MPNQLPCSYENNSLCTKVILLVIVAVLQSACVGHAPRPAPVVEVPEVPPTQFQSELGRTALLVRVELPELQFMGYAHNKKLAASVASNDTIRGFGGVGCSGADIGTCILAQAVVGAAVILVAAPIAAASAEKKSEAATKSEAAVAPVLGSDLIRDALRDAIASAAQSDGLKLESAPTAAVKDEETEPDYRALAANGLDTVLEVTLNQVFLEPAVGLGGKLNLDPVLPLDIRVHVRLVKVSDNSLLFSDDFAYHGKRYQYSRWAANDGEQLVSGLNKGYESLGRDVSERILLLHPFVDRIGKGESGNCGLGVIAPNAKVVEDLSPLLSWQSFPRESDLSADAHDMKLVKNVRYELVVGSGDNGETPDMFYRVRELTETSHKLPMKLNPNTRYFWSVRARFELNGRQRVTEWATSCPFEQQLIVGARIYRFYTPKG